MGNLPKKQLKEKSMTDSTPDSENKSTVDQITITNSVDFSGAAFVLAAAVFAFAYLEVGVIFENSKGEQGVFLSVTNDLW